MPHNGQRRNGMKVYHVELGYREPVHCRTVGVYLRKQRSTLPISVEHEKRDGLLYFTITGKLTSPVYDRLLSNLPCVPNDVIDNGHCKEPLTLIS